MSFDLTGRKALVTGASRGIGRAIALAFAQAGADVVVLARDEERLREVSGAARAAGADRVIVIPADVTDHAALAAAVGSAAEQLDGLDILVNNAGGNSFAVPLATMRMSGWQRNFALNVESVAVACQAAFPALAAGGSASVINVSSVVALLGAPLMSHYAAAKAAVVSLTKSLAIEWAHAGIRVNALLPGWVETDLTEFLRVSPEGEQALLSRVPFGRWARPEEIAEPAVFLASSAAGFMTGQALVVDGGLSAMP